MYLSAPIKIESKPTVDKQLNDDNSVNITWSPPVNKSGIPNEVIFYDILCYTCIDSVCNKSCEDLTYIPNQYNVTRTSVRVSGLVPGQSYKFRIFPKNNLNYRIPKEDWNFIESEPYTFQSTGNNLFFCCVIFVLFLPIKVNVKWYDYRKI